jgi:uncharacterized OB-fold protein
MRSETSSKEQIPIGKGLFVMPLSPSEKPYLIGNRCRSCGEVFFPTRRCCRRCSSDDLKEIALGRTAKLYSFTTVRVRIPDSKVEPPYLVGIVEFPEGERARTLLADCDPASLKVGADMELMIEAVYEDELGRQILGWKYRPLKGTEK